MDTCSYVKWMVYLTDFDLLRHFRYLPTRSHDEPQFCIELTRNIYCRCIHVSWTYRYLLRPSVIKSCNHVHLLLHCHLRRWTCASDVACNFHPWPLGKNLRLQSISIGLLLISQVVGCWVWKSHKQERQNDGVTNLSFFVILLFFLFLLLGVF